MKKYTIYWRMNDKTVVEGDTIENAFSNAGYGGGAVAAIDFFVNGEDDSYTWNTETRNWDKK